MIGLEMYAYRRQYMKFEEEQTQNTLDRLRKVFGRSATALRQRRLAMIDNQVMYWRKANHIHRWFVDNVQKGDDDFGKYLVTWEKLEELKDACTKVLEASKLVDGLVYGGAYYNDGQLEPEVRRIPGKVIQDVAIARTYLPTSEGPLFGSGEYDEHYLNEVRATKSWIESMFADRDSGILGDIYYESTV